jgi:hypothetical protein
VEDTGRESFCLRYKPDSAEGERWTKVESSTLKPGDRIVVPSRIGGCDEWGWDPQSKAEVADLGAEAHYLQRLKGAVRVTRATLANALRREEREDQTDDVWDVIARELQADAEEAAPAEPRHLVEGILASERTLPRGWQALLEGRDGLKGIRDRRPNVMPLSDMDWSKGSVLYADKALDAGLLAEDTEDEPDGTEAVTERDDSSRIGEAVPLAAHLAHVEKHARAFGRRAGLDDGLVELVALAGRSRLCDQCKCQYGFRHQHCDQYGGGHHPRRISAYRRSGHSRRHPRQSRGL